MLLPCSWYTGGLPQLVPLYVSCGLCAAPGCVSAVCTLVGVGVACVAAHVANEFAVSSGDFRQGLLLHWSVSPVP